MITRLRGFQIVNGGQETVEAICDHPGIAGVTFVGSTKVGRYVYEEGTKRGKRVGSYTSAKNAMLVLPDADMDLVADAAVAAAGGATGPDWKLDGVNLLPFLNGKDKMHIFVCKWLYP